MADRYADADPDETVSVGGQAMSLRTAVRRWIKAREETRGTPNIITGITPREAGREPGSFLPEDMDKLAEMERFR